MPQYSPYVIGPAMSPSCLPRLWPIVDSNTEIVVALATTELNAKLVRNRLNKLEGA